MNLLPALPLCPGERERDYYLDDKAFTTIPKSCQHFVQCIENKLTLCFVACDGVFLLLIPALRQRLARVIRRCPQQWILCIETAQKATYVVRRQDRRNSYPMGEQTRQGRFTTAGCASEEYTHWILALNNIPRHFQVGQRISVMECGEICFKPRQKLFEFDRSIVRSV